MGVLTLFDYKQGTNTWDGNFVKSKTMLEEVDKW